MCPTRPPLAGRHPHRLSHPHYAGAASSIVTYDDAMSAPRPSQDPEPRSPSKEPADPTAPKVLHDADGFVIAAWKNIALHLWTVAATPAMVAKLDEFSVAFTGAHPEGISAIHVIAKGAPLPDKDVRDQLRQVSDRHAKHVACVCHVVEGSGFWASALQSFLTGLHWLTQRSYSLHICSDIAAAAQWVPEPHALKTKVTIVPAELEEAIRFVRRRGD